MMRLDIQTEEDYFDALEFLYGESEHSNQARELFKILLKMCKRFEKQKRRLFWQHLQWSN